jgi:hypothetical protein
VRILRGNIPASRGLGLPLKRALIVVDGDSFQPAIPCEGHFRTRKQDCKRDHADNHQEFNQKEGKQ